MTVSISRLFPNFYAAVGSPEHALWARPADWTDIRLLFDLATLVDGHLLPAMPASPDTADRLAHAVLLDLRGLQQVLTGDQLTQSHFLQLRLGVDMMKFGTTTGLFQIAYDWIILSLSDASQSDTEVEFETGRFDAFLGSSHPFVSLNALTAYFEWSEVLFYYSRLQGAHRGIAETLLPGVLRACQLAAARVAQPDPNPLSREHAAIVFGHAVTAAIQAVPWAGKNGVEAADALLLIESAYTSPYLSPAQRARCGLFLSTAYGSPTDEARGGWARRVLAEYGPHLAGYDRIQLLTAPIISIEEAATRRGEFVSEVRQVALEALVGCGGDYPLFFYGQARLFDVLNRLVKLLADQGHCDYVVEVLAAWYSVPDELRRRGDCLLVCPTHEAGVLYATEGRVALVELDQDASLARLTEAGNYFFGTNVTLPDVTELPPHLPDRRGVPVASAAPDYEAALADHYRLDAASKLLRADPASARAIVALPGPREPLQALLKRASGVLLPHATSLERPEPDRPVCRVLFWPGGTFYSAIGLEAAAAILDRHGVTCHFAPEDDLSTARFLDAYASAEYDVLWVSAHAEYDHYEPHRAYVRLSGSDGPTASLEQLIQIPVPSGSRRLLFLNVCDGATASPMPGLARLGLAPALAGRSQAVVSQLWPVEQTYSTLLDGLLAVGLARTGSFLPAFDLAVEVMIAGLDRSLALIEEELGTGCELVRRLAGRTLELDNLSAWASAAFFE